MFQYLYISKSVSWSIFPFIFLFVNVHAPLLQQNFVLFSVSTLYELWSCNICRFIKLCENSTNFSPVGCRRFRRCCRSCSDGWFCCCCCCWCSWSGCSCQCFDGCWACDASKFILDKHLAKLIFAIWSESLPKSTPFKKNERRRKGRKIRKWVHH